MSDRNPDATPPTKRAAETISATRPDDVPDDLVAMGADAHEAWHLANRRSDVEIYRRSHEAWVRAVLAAVLPVHERQVREQVAAEIRAVALDRDLTREDRYETTGECRPYWRDVWRTDGLWGALLIARGCHTCSCEETRECLRESIPGADPEEEAQ